MRRLWVAEGGKGGAQAVPTAMEVNAADAVLLECSARMRLDYAVLVLLRDGSHTVMLTCGPKAVAEGYARWLSSPGNVEVPEGMDRVDVSVALCESWSGPPEQVGTSVEVSVGEDLLEDETPEEVERRLDELFSGAHLASMHSVLLCRMEGSEKVSILGLFASDGHAREVRGMLVSLELGLELGLELLVVDTLTARIGLGRKAGHGLRWSDKGGSCPTCGYAMGEMIGTAPIESASRVVVVCAGCLTLLRVELAGPGVARLDLLKHEDFAKLPDDERERVGQMVASARAQGQAGGLFGGLPS